MAMQFDEYIPNGGWMKYNARKRLTDKLKTAGLIAIPVLAYALVGYLEVSLGIL